MRLTNDRTYIRDPDRTVLTFGDGGRPATIEEKLWRNFGANGLLWKATVIGTKAEHQRVKSGIHGEALDDNQAKSALAKLRSTKGLIPPPKDEGLCMADLTNALQVATDELMQAFDTFERARSRFKGEMKNDAASIAAGADKIAAEFRKAQTAMLSFQAAMVSEPMQTAIANAERLASALAAINATHSHKITLAVIDNKPTT